MENEKNEEIQEEEELELPEVAEGEEDTTDWKELALKQQGINKRLKTKIKKAKEDAKEEKPEKKEEPKKEPEKPEDTPSELDYGQKTFINQILKVDLSDEKQLGLVKDYVANGKTLDDLKGNKHFKNDLKDLKDAKKAEEALPSSTKRSSSKGKSAVDYWLAKPFSEVPKEMRQEVLNERLKRDEKQKMFG